MGVNWLIVFLLIYLIWFQNHYKAPELNLKTSIQLLHELKPIQPIKFEHIASEGPSHKPLFKYKLSITISNVEKAFYADGNSLKNSKKTAALKCLNYITTTNEFPPVISPCNLGYIRAVIDNDFKTLSVDKTVSEWLTSEVTLQSISEEAQAVKKPLVFLDNKSREILATKNVLSILNHFLQTIDYEFIDCESTCSLNTKQFKIVLNIKKSDILEAKRLSFGTVTPDSSGQRKSTLMCETLDELKFYGVASNKKSAKVRAGQLALENIFNLKIEAGEV